MHTLRQSAPPALPAAIIETQQPARASRLESEVWVPVMQTVITALIVVAGLALVSWRVGWPIDVALFGGCVTLAVMWTWRILRNDKLMWQIERLTRHGWSQDGVQGQPDPVVVNPDAARKTAEQNQARDTAAVQRSLIAFVYLCASVDKPTEAALGIPTGDRAGYVKYRDKLIDDLGIGAWHDPGNHDRGWRLVVTPEVAAAIIEKHII